jgi:hypothetical protein
MEARVATVRTGGYATHRKNLTAIKLATAPAMQLSKGASPRSKHPIDKPRQAG